MQTYTHSTRLTFESSITASPPSLTPSTLLQLPPGSGANGTARCTAGMKLNGIGLNACVEDVGLTVHMDGGEDEITCTASWGQDEHSTCARSHQQTQARTCKLQVMIPVRAKSFRWHWNRIKLATGCSSVSQSAPSWAPTCAHPTDELAVSALFCCAFRVLTADPSHSISDASNIMKRDCVRPVVDRLQAEDGDDQKRCFERFFYCWCTNPAPMLLPPLLPVN